MKPYYDRDGQTIYLGDCREVLPTLKTWRVDLVLTDPPYGINHASSHGASWEDTIIAGDSDTTVRDEILEMVLDLPCAVFGTWKTQPIANARGCLVWDKGPAFGMGDLSFPWKQSWELIYIRGNRWIGSRDEGVLRGPCVVSWESKGRCHPHQKPAWIITRLMNKQPTAETILDPFMGSGTTLRATKNSGRRGIGIEIDERYCEIAAKRLEQGVLNFEAVES